jgi:hypothetical protein
MRLSAEMYDQITAALKSDLHGNKDKRREPRVGLAGEVGYVTVTDKGKRMAGVVRVRDVSPSGIGLFFSEQIAKEQRFVLQLASSNRKPLWLVCLAAYCRKVDGGRFSVGARIHQVLRADQIQKIEAQTAAANAPVNARTTAVKQREPLDVTDIERISKAILG